MYIFGPTNLKFLLHLVCIVQIFIHLRLASRDHRSQRRLLCTRHRQTIRVLDLDPHLRICAPIACCIYHNESAFSVLLVLDLLSLLCFSCFSHLPPLDYISP